MIKIIFFLILFNSDFDINPYSYCDKAKVYQIFLHCVRLYFSEKIALISGLPYRHEKGERKLLKSWVIHNTHFFLFLLSLGIPGLVISIELNNEEISLSVNIFSCLITSIILNPESSAF